MQLYYIILFLFFVIFSAISLYSHLIFCNILINLFKDIVPQKSGNRYVLSIALRCPEATKLANKISCIYSSNTSLILFYSVA